MRRRATPQNQALPSRQADGIHSALRTEYLWSSDLKKLRAAPFPNKSSLIAYSSGDHSVLLANKTGKRLRLLLDFRTTLSKNIPLKVKDGETTRTLISCNRFGYILGYEENGQKVKYFAWSRKEGFFYPEDLFSDKSKTTQALQVNSTGEILVRQYDSDTYNNLRYFLVR